MTATALLLDLDGVLVQPRGYRAAVQATFRHFVDAWGWSLPSPDEDDLAFLEAHGITSEWDMLPLLLGAALDAWAAQTGRVPPPMALTHPAPLRPAPPALDLRAAVMRLAPHLRPEETPADTALRLQRQGSAQVPFPHLDDTPLTTALLAHTRAVERHPITRCFQEFTLGSTAFARTYGLPPRLDTPSLLQTHDRPLLSPAWQARLRTADGVQRAAYTARPSVPPLDHPAGAHGYAPEAELALELVRLGHMPCIGYGHLLWFAERHALPPGESLLKPAPMHALAALLAAWLGDPAAALERAWAFLHGDRDALDGLPPFPWRSLALDDTVKGLQGVLAAVTALRSRGLAVHAHLLGVGENPEKVAALRSFGVPVYPDVNAALEAGWRALQGDDPS